MRDYFNLITISILTAVVTIHVLEFEGVFSYGFLYEDNTDHDDLDVKLNLTAINGSSVITQEMRELQEDGSGGISGAASADAAKERLTK